MLDRRQGNQNFKPRNLPDNYICSECKKKKQTAPVSLHLSEEFSFIVSRFNCRIFSWGFSKKLVDSLHLECFWAHWATSSRHGSLFTRLCFSPTRCYGKFGPHNGSDSIWSVIISLSRFFSLTFENLLIRGKFCITGNIYILFFKLSL